MAINNAMYSVYMVLSAISDYNLLHQEMGQPVYEIT